MASSSSAAPWQPARDSDALARPLLEPAPSAAGSGGSGRAAAPNVRDVSLDLMRGFIMLIMAWDHTTHSFTNDKDSVHTPGAESWNGPFASYDNNPRLFVSRAVSHICAPGFFFTMGIGMALFSQSRFAAGWAFSQVWQHYLLRGAVLFVAGRLVNFPGYLGALVDIGVHNRTVMERFPPAEFRHGDEGTLLRDSWLSVFEVMEALALSMMLSPVFLLVLSKIASVRAPTVRRLGSTELAGWAAFFFFFCVSNLAIVLAQGDDPSDASGPFPKSNALANSWWKVVARFTFFSGMGPVNYMFIAYPFVPWIGITCLGQGMGYLYMKDVSLEVRRARLAQMASLLPLAFVLVRLLGGKFGNNRGWPRHDHGSSSLMEFFSVCKYPPDLAYATITLSVNCLIILVFTHSAFSKVEPLRPSVRAADAPEASRSEGDAERAVVESESNGSQAFRKRWPVIFKPVLTFGRAPLFFYILHFFVIGVFEAVCRLPSPPSGKFPLEGVVVVWSIVLVCMNFACTKYVAFKATTPVDSLWRLL